MAASRSRCTSQRLPRENCRPDGSDMEGLLDYIAFRMRPCSALSYRRSHLLLLSQQMFCKLFRVGAITLLRELRPPQSCLRFSCRTAYTRKQERRIGNPMRSREPQVGIASSRYRHWAIPTRCRWRSKALTQRSAGSLFATKRSPFEQYPPVDRAGGNRG